MFKFVVVPVSLRTLQRRCLMMMIIVIKTRNNICSQDGHAWEQYFVLNASVNEI